MQTKGDWTLEAKGCKNCRQTTTTAGGRKVKLVLNPENLAGQQKAMDASSVREERSLSAAGSNLSRDVMTAESGDRTETAAILRLLEVRREEEELDVKMEERRQLKESLKQQMEELEKKIQEVAESRSRFDVFLKDEYNINSWAEKAERARQECLLKAVEIKRLTEETVRLVERKQELLRQVERHTPYRDFMERMVKMTRSEDADRLTDHIERLLHLKDQLIQKDTEAQEKIDQQRKRLLMMEDQHRLLRLHKKNQLAQLETELEETCSETLTWERKWKHIQETAAKKTLLLGQIKMATLNLYEKTEDEGVDINDTEKQLDKIQRFIEDHHNIVKRYQTGQSEEQKGEEQKKGKAKKWNS